MSAEVGADIASLCNKCGDVWHVVIAKVGEDIAKVECKECHGVHRYRDPEGKKKSAAKKTSRAKSTKASTRKSSTKSDAAKPIIEPNMNKPVQDYRISASFEPGDRVSHVKFGLGVAQRSPGPGKIEILFEDGAKLLAMTKPDSTIGQAPRNTVAHRAALETELPN